MMNTPLMTALVLVHTWITHPASRRNERGSVSVEQAVITGALALLAVAVIGLISNFAQGRLVGLG